MYDFKSVSHLVNAFSKIWNITSQEQIIERYLTLILQIDLLTQSLLNRLDKKNFLVYGGIEKAPLVRGRFFQYQIA